MKHWMFSLWVILFLIPSVFASWETHEGVTSWKVQVTDDLRACGESAKTKVYTFSITHNQKVARIADPVHGMASGTFEGDVLHVVSRTIPDGSGSSKLSAFDVIFTCTAIQAKYRWDYKDSQMSCSGTTEWRGTRYDGTACPGTITPQPDLAKEITEIRSEEDKLKAALAKDPKNFWANWDMAELKKNRGDYKEYFNYLNRATGNEQVFAETRQQLKDEARKQLGLSDYPSPTAVPLLRAVHDEVAQGGIVYNVEFPAPGETYTQRLKTMLWAAITPDSTKILKEIAGIKEEQ